ncbi:MAG TPA: hypothetical protein VN457_02830, partial [Chlamydiales bacterium]|nr:hypothetical protein [Chlamydiales bacterium]
LLSPILALKQLDEEEIIPYVELQVRQNLFVRLFLFIVALLPFFVIQTLIAAAAKWALLSSGAAITDYAVPVQYFFLLVPSALLLAPAVIFFYHMAAEAQVFVQKRTG